MLQPVGAPSGEYTERSATIAGWAATNPISPSEIARNRREFRLPSANALTSMYLWPALAGLVLGVVLLVLHLQMRRRMAHVLQSQADRVRQLRQTRTHDALTGLFKRTGFEHELQRILERCAADKDKACVLYLDVDQFQTINDAFGTSVGATVLIDMVQRIKSHGDQGQPAARIAANGFATVVRADPLFGDAFAQKLGQAMTSPFSAGDAVVHLTYSIGIAAYPAQSCATGLVDKAAAAMRVVQANGGMGRGHDDAASDQARRQDARLLQDLRGAVERGKLILHYQPKVDATSLQITAAEVLMRWRHPTLGVLGPDKFIPLAERHGLIRQLGRWAIEQSCKQAAVWREQGLRMCIAVNISADQFHQDDFIDHLEETLAKTDIASARFTC